MKLLILDIDETLIYGSEEELEKKSDFIVENYKIYKRPGVNEFLEIVFRMFKIGIWTTANQNYAEKIVEKLCINKNDLEFLWTRKKCNIYYDKNTGSSFLIKNLRKVKRLGYNLEEVIVIDDSPEKHIKNYGNLIVVSSFIGQSNDQELNCLSKYLLWLNLQSNIRTIEKRFWKSFL